MINGYTMSIVRVHISLFRFLDMLNMLLCLDRSTTMISKGSCEGATIYPDVMPIIGIVCIPHLLALALLSYTASAFLWTVLLCKDS
jgi:hypothetical protein